MLEGTHLTVQAKGSILKTDRQPSYDIDDSSELEIKVKQRAQAEGLRAEGWVRRIVEQQFGASESKDNRPVSEMIRELWADMPDEIREKLPADGASQHDHYIYGLPKRDH
ncbi:MAG TPA: hypothetical protein VFB14_09060 [Bryobacteraceae bacterium]|jgi:hypothetical protein|nr:hypothetical protein [Bryobacteraceae bacterium]